MPTGLQTSLSLALIIVLFPIIEARMLQGTAQTESGIPFDYLIVACVGLGLLVIGILVYR